MRYNPGMAYTYLCLAYHVVFSTKERRPFLTEPLQDAMRGFMGGIARHNKFQLVGSGSMPDHVHLLLTLPADLALSKAVQLIKGGSSKWFRETHDRHFNWQEGYGGFTVSHSMVPRTLAYLRNQKVHHRKMDFVSEYRLLLEKHGIKYEERYLL